MENNAIRIDVATLFPEMCEAVLSESIVGRARKAGLLDIACHNIRAYSESRHNKVDDYAYGGGMGMVMQPQPIYDCFRAVCAERGRDGERPHVIYLSPQGKTLTQEKCIELAGKPHLFLLCGHYEGVDERLLEEIVDEEISIGDYVLTGGELPALVLIDAVARMREGVLSDSACYEEESHFGGLLEYPQYTRPEEWNGRRVPEVLLSGHHENVAAWRQVQRLVRTRQKRPDLMERYTMTLSDQKLLKKAGLDTDF